MAPREPLKLVFGGGVFMRITDLKEAQQFLDQLKALDVNTIDTAKIYVDSEKILGELHAPTSFIIDTKHPGGFAPGTATKENVVEVGLASLERLQTKKVDIYYIHAADPSVPVESTLAGINELYERGTFARFGISNYTPEQVQELYDVCKSKGYVLPTVYQGNYNAMARNYDETLFPLLRKLGISFYAYSPSAGGFLSKTKQQILEGVGRFSDKYPMGKLYSTLYKKPSLIDALTDWGSIAEENHAKPTELAYRWLVWNSILSPEHGDAMIFGSRSIEQMKETVEWVRKGPLPDDAVKKIDEVWEKVKHEAPTNNLEGFGK